MLRLLVLALVLANIVFYTWTRGSLDGVVGMRAQGDREPERLNRQVRPDSVHVLPAAAASSALQTGAEASAAPLPTVCLEAGPYSASQIGAVESAMQAVMPPGSWVNIKTERPPVWLVYMGKYSNRELMQKKIDELRRLRLPFEEVHSPPELSDGLSLGSFESRAAAEKSLTDLTARGVRTARVAPLLASVITHVLRVDRADGATQSKITSLRAEALQGKVFSACAASKP